MNILAITFLLTYVGNIANSAELFQAGYQSKDFQTESDQSTKGVILNLSQYSSDKPVYTSPAYFGSDSQGGRHSAFLLDTTTSFVAITSTDCDNCDDGERGGLFDKEESDSFSQVGDPHNPITITIDATNVEGYWGKDTVELKGQQANGSTKLEVDDFEFFLITHLNSGDFNTDFDGVIGLGAPQDSNQG